MQAQILAIAKEGPVCLAGHCGAESANKSTGRAARWCHSASGHSAAAAALEAPTEADPSGLR